MAVCRILVVYIFYNFIHILDWIKQTVAEGEAQQLTYLCLCVCATLYSGIKKGIIGFKVPLYILCHNVQKKDRSFGSIYQEEKVKLL